MIVLPAISRARSDSRLLTAMEKKQKKIAALMQGHTSPFNVEYIIRAWDQTREGLAAKTAAIKNAINGMNGAQYLACVLPTHRQETLLPKLAGLSLGPLLASEALRGNALSRGCTAVQCNVHWSPRTSGSAVRRQSAQSCRRNDFRRIKRK